MKILAFGASSSRNSINKAMVKYASGIIEDEILETVEIELIDIGDYEMPLYSIDREHEEGIPDRARLFYKIIGEADALMISFAEHNGFYTAVYKNLFDWASRIGKQVYQSKPSIILSTAPGAGGAKNVLKTARGSADFYGMEVLASLSIPKFKENFNLEKGELTNPEWIKKLRSALESIRQVEIRKKAEMR